MKSDLIRKKRLKKLIVLFIVCFLCLPSMTSCSLKKLPDQIKELMNKQSEAIDTEALKPEEITPIETPQPSPTASAVLVQEQIEEPTTVPSESTPSLKDILKDILKSTITGEPESNATDSAEPTAMPTTIAATDSTVNPVATPTPKVTTKPVATPTSKPTEKPADIKTYSAIITPPPIANNITLEEYAELILSLIIKEDMNKVEKIKAVHDYIVRNTKYDQTRQEDLPESSFAIEGVLYNREAVCQGYAYTFQLFMDLLDITSNVVVGSSVASGIGHAWNMVYLGETWYMVDTTWDDPVMEDAKAYPDGIIRYNYFLMPDSVLSIDHKWNRSDYPVCSSTKYMYYIYEDNIIDSIDDYETEFIKRYKAGQRTITLLYPEDGTPSSKFMTKYDFLRTETRTKTETGTTITYTASWSVTPPWRLGEYTVFTVEVD
ncbi:MAG: transglutaminase domain-containing protein [Mobilitalea sp.]